MVILHRPALLSAAVMALAAMGLKALLSGWMLPRMLAQGNGLMMREVVGSLENYFVDFQEWPAGAAEETLWRLMGARPDRLAAMATETGAPVPTTAQVGAAPTAKADTSKAPAVRHDHLLPSVNYLRSAKARSAGLTLADAWGRPLEFSFLPDGPATVTSLGDDGVMGTADDVTATANIMPRKTQPTRALFIADREFRRSEVVRRLKHAQRLAEKSK